MAGNLSRGNDLRIGRGIALKLVTLAGLLFLLAPLAVIVVYSFNAGRSTMVWEGFSLQWYEKALHDRSLWLAVRNSLIIGIASALVTTALSVMFALAIGMRRFRGRALLMNFLHIPIVLPEVIFGVSLLAFFVLAHFPLGLTSITCAHITFSIPFVTLVILTRVEHFDRTLEAASLDLGAGRWLTFRRVILPAIAPAVGTGALLAFALSFDDFVVTFFTAGPGSSTLPLKIYSLVKFGVTPALNAVSTIFIVTTVLLALAAVAIRNSARFKRAIAIAAALPGGAIIVLTGAMMFGGDGDKELHISNYSDYMDESLFADFERETGIHVSMDYYNDNEELYAKLKTGAAGFDVVIPSSYMVSILARQGLLQPIDYARTPNARLVDPFFTRMPFDSGCVYSVPYVFGACGIAYNSAIIREPVASWGALWDARYARRILMVDDMRSAFSTAYGLIGAHIEDRRAADLRAAAELLARQKPLVKKYESNTIADFLLNGEAWIAQIWNGMAVKLVRDHPEFRFVLPRERKQLFVDNLCVPVNAEHKDAAFRFIDFLLRPENAARNMRTILYGMPYPAAQALLSDTLRANAAMFPVISDTEDYEIARDLGDFNEQLERAWLTVKSR